MYRVFQVAIAIVATAAANAIAISADPKLVLPAIAPTSAPAVTFVALLARTSSWAMPRMIALTVTGLTI